MGMLSNIKSKYEIHRLEQRYVNRGKRNGGFSSSAVYVDGEYIYNQSNSMVNKQSKSSKDSSASSGSLKTAVQEKVREIVVFTKG